jgi:hypothetical protein
LKKLTQKFNKQIKSKDEIKRKKFLKTKKINEPNKKRRNCAEPSHANVG